MRTRFSKTAILGAVFLVALSLLPAQPLLAGEKAKDEKTADPAADVDADTGQRQDEIDRVLANGPPVDLKSPPGLYVKVRGNSAGMTKEFKNGHPNNNSEWVYCPGGICPYGQ